MKTQRTIIESKLKKDGVINNVWAIHKGILRLGGWIHILRKDGWDIETDYENRKGKRNCHYRLNK